MNSGSTLLIVAALSAVALCNLSCYQCNSYDPSQPKCGSSEASDLVGFKKACSRLVEGEFANKNAIGCRKILQSINEETSVVRECAYSGEDVDGLKKTGTQGIQLYYYQCSGDLCNGASTVSLVSAALVTVVAMLH